MIKSTAQLHTPIIINEAVHQDSNIHCHSIQIQSLCHLHVFIYIYCLWSIVPNYNADVINTCVTLFNRDKNHGVVAPPPILLQKAHPLILVSVI